MGKGLLDLINSHRIAASTINRDGRTVLMSNFRRYVKARPDCGTALKPSVKGDNKCQNLACHSDDKNNESLSQRENTIVSRRLFHHAYENDSFLKGLDCNSEIINEDLKSNSRSSETISSASDPTKMNANAVDVANGPSSFGPHIYENETVKAPEYNMHKKTTATVWPNPIYYLTENDKSVFSTKNVGPPRVHYCISYKLCPLEPSTSESHENMTKSNPIYKQLPINVLLENDPEKKNRSFEDNSSASSHFYHSIYENDEMEAPRFHVQEEENKVVNFGVISGNNRSSFQSENDDDVSSHFYHEICETHTTEIMQRDQGTVYDTVKFAPFYSSSAVTQMRATQSSNVTSSERKNTSLPIYDDVCEEETLHISELSAKNSDSEVDKDFRLNPVCEFSQDTIYSTKRDEILYDDAACNSYNEEGDSEDVSSHIYEELDEVFLGENRSNKVYYAPGKDNSSRYSPKCQSNHCSNQSRFRSKDSFPIEDGNSLGDSCDALDMTHEKICNSSLSVSNSEHDQANVEHVNNNQSYGQHNGIFFMNSRHSISSESESSLYSSSLSSTMVQQSSPVDSEIEIYTKVHRNFSHGSILPEEPIYDRYFSQRNNNMKGNSVIESLARQLNAQLNRNGILNPSFIIDIPDNLEEQAESHKKESPFHLIMQAPVLNIPSDRNSFLSRMNSAEENGAQNDSERCFRVLKISGCIAWGILLILVLTFLFYVLYLMLKILNLL